MIPGEGQLYPSLGTQQSHPAMAASQRQHGVKLQRRQVLLCTEHPLGSLCFVMLLVLAMGLWYLHPWEGKGQCCPNQEQQGWHSLGTEPLCPAWSWWIWDQTHTF